MFPPVFVWTLYASPSWMSKSGLDQSKPISYAALALAPRMRIAFGQTFDNGHHEHRYDGFSP